MLPLPSRLSNAQQQVLTLLASGSTINEAAAAASVHRNTIANWRRSSESFRENWNTMQYEQAMHWRDQLQSLAPIALEALQTLLTDPKTPPSVRLRAAMAVLDKVTVPAPAQPDLHKSAQPAAKSSLPVLETIATPPVHVPDSAQRCTTAAIDVEPTEQEFEEMLAELTGPPIEFPRPPMDQHNIAR